MLGLIRGDLLACCVTRAENIRLSFSVGRRLKEDG